MSRLITVTLLRLEDLTVCVHTNTVEFHVYHCVLRLPFLCQGGYTFYYSNPHVLSCETIPRTEDPITTIIAIPDYHVTKAGRYLSIQANTFNQIMVPGYLNLAKPPRCIWKYEEEEQKEEEVKFDWFTSSEDDIRAEVARILEERERLIRNGRTYRASFTAHSLCHFPTYGLSSSYHAICTLHLASCHLPSYYALIFASQPRI
ncbi:hypothetical protein PILCRDRAFT_17355 [Piloderma croceum F 1598]|uniref:Uncharacterized protein n=1 Tax=Piloderma croceum (strain F 1598) TaxID=765440 RepID=A0A0C3EER8_PILCF|nr:hypothetical protein PILCRDRAFT_17355 [Piloderma croceum F 1598]